MQELDLLLDSCTSPVTRHHYPHYFMKYQKFMGSDLFCDNNPRIIEQKIIKFIMELRKEKLSSNGIACYAAPIESFYAINDVTLNVKKK